MAPLSGKSLPLKLKNDAIVEAILEVRFQTAMIPEIFFGRIADYDPWKRYTQRRMPVYEFPASFRQADPNLRYAPVFELVNFEQHRVLRVGAQVLSYHCLQPYVGWEKFRAELDQVVSAVFQTVHDLKVERLGLRYTNALRSSTHGIRGIKDLDLKVEIAGMRVSDNINVNFTEADNDTMCTVRIATPQFVQGGTLPSDTMVYVDVDVYTREGPQIVKEDDARAWIKAAHDREKEQFFSLLPVERIEALREK
jgi:uncharacterized protein (TIGR04255 family)